MNLCFLKNDASMKAIRHHRLVDLIKLTLIGLILTTLQNLFFGKTLDALIFFGGLLATSISFGLAQYKRLESAASLFTLSLTTMMVIIHWSDSGIYDPGMLMYPALIIFTGLLCAPWLFILQFIVIVINLSFLILAEAQGWRISPIAPPGLPYWLDTILIMSIVTAGVALIMKDFRQAVLSLQAENMRVSKSQKEVEFLATHDALTHLPNRVLARDRCAHALEISRRNQQKTAVFYIDLDNFKTINDSLGHDAGDRLLVEMARRLKSCVRQSDTVARQGGDEFLIILDQIQDAAICTEIANKVIRTLAQPITLKHLQITATCSIGIAVSNRNADDFDTLLQQADMAMYRAKAAGRNAMRIYDESMNTKAAEQLHLASKMRTALSKSEFTLHYQPQFDLKSGQIIGAEALVRWRHPELGLVPPGKFIPVAENSGLIVEMGEWIVQEACRQAKQWHDEGLGGIVIGINISPIQFRRGDVEKLVADALRLSGLPAELIELELTESLLLEDSDHLKVILQNLRSLGLSFSIDDFGTGYSNLSYLKHFEVERLKIDQSFIRRLTEDAHDEAIVSAIIQVANSLKLQLIAEGIEDQATLNRLIELGCEQGQGYFWSPAIPAEEFKQFVLHHRSQLSAS
ncbi:EAL domain-containing protein [Chitinibacter sp. SCUT-21]|uniref:putative bifunctional diguanylate cyclase/phosphodiesterase n=1 Tax=Chitinibacter sp. SCUT-21 TaxID=2970891 RepID=UPI0035A64650